MTPQEQKIFDIQCESTKKLMLAQMKRSIAEDEDYIRLIKLTPIIDSAQCVKEDGTVDLNVREISSEEYALHTGMRYKAGERLAQLRTERPKYTLTEEKKERAVSAFLRKFSLDSIKDKFKSIMKGIYKPSYAEIVADALKKNL